MYSTKAIFDKYGRLTAIDGAATNVYDHWPTFHEATGALNATVDNGNAYLAMTTDEVRGETARFSYNTNGTLAKKTVTDEADFSHKISQETFEYDSAKRLTKDTCTYDVTNGKSVGSVISYRKEADDPAADNAVRGYTYKVNNLQQAHTAIAYDIFNRVDEKTVQLSGDIFVKSFTYDKTRAQKVADMFLSKNLGTHSYTYDANGRIQSVSYTSADTNSDYQTYAYDQYGQLVRENNQGLAKTYIYEYNDDGNITSVNAYPFSLSTTPSGTPVTTTFDYTNDQLTTFDGTAIAYNSLGYPTTYEGMDLTWNKGKLSNMRKGTLKTGTRSHLFTYNGFGQRVSKRYTRMLGTSEQNHPDDLFESIQQYYYDHSGRLIAETCSKKYFDETEESYRIVYLYDESSIIGMAYTPEGGNAQLYYFQRNLLGDVVGIFDTSGGLVVRYLYDAWGNCTISGKTTNNALAHANPIRYRGYYYDDDTGLYYCNARYYSPKWRRFISPDDTAYLDPKSVNGLNLYCYCNNDPINKVDPSGHFAFLVALAIAGATLGFGLAAYSDYQADGIWFNGNIGSYVAYTLGGAIIGAVAGASVSALLTGSFFSSVGAVKAGALLTGKMLSVGGFGATGAMLLDNFQNALHYSTHIFWSGGDLPQNAAGYLAGNVSGTTLGMTHLGQYLSNVSSINVEAWRIASVNFANQVQSGSTVFVVQSSAGVSIESIWATTEFPILIKKIIDMIYVVV